MTAAMNIRLHILEESTNGFSANSIIGRGGFGDVYKGVLPNGEVIAVKLLHDDPVNVLDDEKFNNEVVNLLRVEHPNIVRLRGYCYETQQEYVEHNGDTRPCKRIYRVLCFEYLQDGSLDRHLHARSFAPNWSTRYNIIKGICEGLNFLHGCKPPIFHLDLKPANVLLDSSMVPKVADFGLSRLFNRSHTHVTNKIIGTQKYMPPEFIKEGIISDKNDVFSLGVVISEIIAAHTSPSISSEMSDLMQFTQEVHTSWKNILEVTSEYPSEELHQVQLCIDTAVSCMEPERNNRPTIADILVTLKKAETRIPKRQLVDVVPFPSVGHKNTLATTLKTMTAELGNIPNKHRHRSFMPKDSFNSNVQQVSDIRETSSSMEESLIIGRTDEKHLILSILSKSMTEEMVILPIYGIGGIGKTTLAQLVFHDTQFHQYSRVWVYVSQDFELKKIGNTIISHLTNETSHIADKQMLHNRLGELFSGRNILIVLDDLWEQAPYELDKLKDMLRPRMGNMVVIVTTRDEAIARRMSMTVMPYKLEILTDDMCWTIIKQKSFLEERGDKEQLENIGRDIAIKCGGVALAAQSLGYMLRDMTSNQWESVRDSYIWNLSTSEGPSSRNNEVLTSLLLSYSHMHEFLQLCFSYCGVLPKGHNIAKYDLIHQWIALGFIEHSSTFDSMQLCEIYITRLLGMSFLQYSKVQSLSDKLSDKDVTLFTIHDLVHDLARAILADKVNKEGNDVGSSCHYALLTDRSKPLQLSVSSTKNSRFKFFLNHFQKRSSLENLKALRFEDCGRLELRDHAFSHAKSLLVLDLSGCFIEMLPNSIGQLKKLRYLHAPRIQDKMIPSCITKLSKLNYLNLRGSCNILSLPKSIGDMKGLIHLDLSGCYEIGELPVSFAELKQLVHLNLSHCYVSISEAFGGFTKLQYLNLSVQFCRRVFCRKGLTKVIGNLIKLRYLNLTGCISFMVSFPPDDEIGSLLDAISTLSNLEHLNLSENCISSIPESIGSLRKLHTLDLSRVPYLQIKLPDSMVNMVSLKVLNVDKSVTLDESVLSRLNVSLPHFVVHSSSHKCSSNIIRLQPTNPDELMIDGLENVRSAEEAQSIRLIEKQNIEELAFKWTLDAERFVDDKEVLEKLVPPSSVKKLCITGYDCVSLPDWLGNSYLPNLSMVEFFNLRKCKSLPPLIQLPNLQSLGLVHMEGSEEWNTTYTSGDKGANEVMFPNLKTLRIVNCDNMLSSWGESSSHSSASSSPITDLIVSCRVPLHHWRLLHQLPALRCLTIGFCSDLTASPEIIQRLSTIDSLRLEFYPAELPRWLVELTSLQALTLFHCGMMSLPQWLGELTALKKFEICQCRGIRSLPDSIQQLTKLKYLLVRGCPKLVEWYESKENKMKLAHISNVKLFRESANAYRPISAIQLFRESDNAHGQDIAETFVGTTNNVDTASGSEINNKGKNSVRIEETVDLIIEVHPDLLYSAVMNSPGFTEEALHVALSHLMDNDAQSSEYMGMQEEQRVSWLMNFLRKHY